METVYLLRGSPVVFMGARVENGKKIIELDYHNTFDVYLVALESVRHLRSCFTLNEAIDLINASASVSDQTAIPAFVVWDNAKSLWYESSAQ